MEIRVIPISAGIGGRLGSRAQRPFLSTDEGAWYVSPQSLMIRSKISFIETGVFEVGKDRRKPINARIAQAWFGGIKFLRAPTVLFSSANQFHFLRASFSQHRQLHVYFATAFCWSRISMTRLQQRRSV